mmetsp:Transcript_49762/g.91019  ORF Transcript_49762/g.91019 Transcript_49762/m.91019 type:complete len:202 (+) Transcript_49762:3473-4078(+)
MFPLKAAAASKLQSSSISSPFMICIPLRVHLMLRYCICSLRRPMSHSLFDFSQPLCIITRCKRSSNSKATLSDSRSPRVGTVSLKFLKARSREGSLDINGSMCFWRNAQAPRLAYQLFMPACASETDFDRQSMMRNAACGNSSFRTWRVRVSRNVLPSTNAQMSSCDRGVRSASSSATISSKLKLLSVLDDFNVETAEIKS